MPLAVGFRHPVLSSRGTCRRLLLMLPPLLPLGFRHPRAAEREASPPRFSVAEEVWSTRAAKAGASLPHSAPALATDAPPQLAVTEFPPTGAGIPANIGVLPPPVVANVGSEATYGPVFGPWPVRRAEGEGDDAPLQTLSPPSRDTEVVSLPAASLGTVWTGTVASLSPVCPGVLGSPPCLAAVASATFGVGSAHL